MIQITIINILKTEILFCLLIKLLNQGNLFEICHTHMSCISELTVLRVSGSGTRIAYDIGN